MNAPREVLAAALLTAEGIELIVVGSAALWLHGDELPVHDLDIVVEPGAQDLGRIVDALSSVGARKRDLPTLRTLLDADLISVMTAYGRVDVMLHRGRVEFPELADRSVVFEVYGAAVQVANRKDALALRALFKVDQ